MVQTKVTPGSLMGTIIPRTAALVDRNLSRAEQESIGLVEVTNSVEAGENH